MTIYELEVKTAKGNIVKMDDYKGKTMLIVNTATGCGFTPQYTELQEMHEKYQEQGFIVLDFPCNQFGNQAPGSIEEISDFCSTKFGITFPMFSKVEVNGENADPLFKYLIEQKGFEGFDETHELTSVLDDIMGKANPNYKNEPSIKWNFTKFLVDKTGNVIARFEPTTDIKKIEECISKIL